MKVLLTGGAGYIGAITARELERQRYQVLVYDHFVSHNPTKLGSTQSVKGDLSDIALLTSTIKEFSPDVVMHFAAYIQMGESVRDPQKYYENNFLGTKNLIEAMRVVGCNRLVFASTAGVYGNPEIIPIPEDHKKEPENPYGETKLSSERLLKWYDQAYGFKSISIRFFNAAGATEELGEDHHDESHIIPNIINALLAGREFTLFGNDYPTPDGTCVRDYIHVLDLAEAFRLSAEKLMTDSAVTTAYNAGTGHGYSNLEIVKMVETISGKPVVVKFEPRRAGDANELVADSSRLKSELGWRPLHSDLESIVKSAYTYHSNLLR
ncbi:MAG: UDP-glucose 4-epimerase GalE [Candidatus Microgenomates bacterium]